MAFGRARGRVRSIGGGEDAEDVRDGAGALQQQQRAVRVRAVEHAVPPLHHHFARNLLVRFHLPANILDNISDVAVGIRHVADVAGAQLLQSAHEDEARVQLNGQVSQTSRARRFNARHMVLDAGNAALQDLGGERVLLSSPKRFIIRSPDPK